MSDLTKCPHCGTEMKHDVDYLDGWLLCEEYYDCPNCGWYSQFSYGQYSEGFAVKDEKPAQALDDIPF